MGSQNVSRQLYIKILRSSRSKIQEPATKHKSSDKKISFQDEGPPLHQLCMTRNNRNLFFLFMRNKEGSLSIPRTGVLSYLSIFSWADGDTASWIHFSFFPFCRPTINGTETRCLEATLFDIFSVFYLSFTY